MKSNRTYLIVGASGTIGSAVAAQLAAPGVSLGLHYCTNHAAASGLKARLERAESTCELFQSDLADESACRDLVERFYARSGAISGVALCGGTVHWKAWRELDRDAWQRVMFEHCVGPFAIARAAIGLMNAANGGRIVFLSSIAPKYGGSPQTMHYAAAKAALEAAMRGLAREVARSGIRVNGVRAGFVQSPQHRHRTPQQIEERIRKIPVGRAGTADEVASAVVYLLSDRAGFVNGELITVAGGD